MLAIWYGEFKTTIFGPGDDVRFGTWQLNTWSEWLGWFTLQLLVGVSDVFFYEYVQPHFKFNVDDDTYLITQYGEGSTFDIVTIALESMLGYFPMVMRITLSVLFVNTQIVTVVLVQIIKEILIFILVYYKLINKQKKGMFRPLRKANEDEAIDDEETLPMIPVDSGKLKI